jgi:hypothetical protein
MKDKRIGRELRLTRYFSGGSVSFGGNLSRESDYQSRAASVLTNLNSEDKNTTLHLGVGVTNDLINPSNQIVSNERKRIVDTLLGVTQVVTRHDIVQLNLTYAAGDGYYSDPYKLFDNRPRQKYQTAALARWNHHFAGLGSTARLSYRYYKDSYNVRAHTVSAEYLQPVGGSWTLTPAIRLHSQSAARFYTDPEMAGIPNFPRNDTQPFSQDQRLSSFGARTIGLKLTRQLGPDWLVDFKYEQYQQQSGWSSFGGSPGLEPFRARSFQVGVSCFF